MRKRQLISNMILIRYVLYDSFFERDKSFDKKKKTVIPAALILSSVIVTFSYLILESEKGRRGAAGEACILPSCVSGALSRHTS